MKIGQIPTDYFDAQANTTKGSRKPDVGLDRAGTPHLAELLSLMQVHRVPSNVETAAFVPAANDTWEDSALITALNLVLTTPIRTGEAVRLLGTLELVNAEANANNVKFGHGDTPDDDGATRNQVMDATIGSEFFVVELITDTSGNIKIETDDITNVTFVFHLEAFQYVHATATA